MHWLVASAGGRETHAREPPPHVCSAQDRSARERHPQPHIAVLRDSEQHHGAIATFGKAVC
eukprot:15435656-Alexandrium_andersonii.AAC.1